MFNGRTNKGKLIIAFYTIPQQKNRTLRPQFGSSLCLVLGRMRTSSLASGCGSKACKFEASTRMCNSVDRLFFEVPQIKKNSGFRPCPRVPSQGKTSTPALRLFDKGTHSFRSAPLFDDFLLNRLEWLK